ncbi:MAG: ATP-binding protein [Candidatus Magnetomorum sp.]|nr:ATP-binding protein [Candidatus Magnetomorum sp.]
MESQLIQNIISLEDDNPFGFIGREQELEALENFFDSHRPVILIHGPTGIGKTTLVRNFMKIRADHTPENHQIFWFSFPNVRTVEFIFNCLAAAYSLQNNFFSLPLDEKVHMLAYILSLHSCTIIIDNFEQATGNISNYLTPIIPDEEMEILESLFTKIQGGSSKFLLISADEDEDIDFDQSADYYTCLPINPLDKKASHTLTKTILNFHDIHVDLKQKDMMRLITIAGGHPLSMKILYSRLLYQSPELLIAKYHYYRHTVIQIGDLTSADYMTHQMTLIHLIISELPYHLTRMVPSLTFYEGSIELDLLYAVINIYHTSVVGFFSNEMIRGMVKDLITFLEHNHLIAKYIPGTENYQIMPLFTEYSRRIAMNCEPQNVKNDWAGAFVHVVARLASNLKTMDNFGKQLWYHFNNATFHQAYEEACNHQMYDHSGILLQIIAAFARLNRNYAKAERCFIELVGIHQALNDLQMQGITLFQLAHIADDQGQYEKAQIYLQKALTIFENANREYESASVYHQLGRIAHQTGDSDIAQRWLKKALKIFNKSDFSYEAADISLHLARIGYEQKDLNRAEKWYQKAIDTFKFYGDEYRTATIYQQLGIIANDRRNFDTSENWFHKARKIYEKLGLDQNLATIYQNTAQAAHAQRDFKTAEKWYAKTFGIIKDTNNMNDLALLYRNIGKMAQDQGNYTRADELYQISQSIYETLSDEDEASFSELLFERGILKGLKGQFEASGKYTIKSILALKRLNLDEEVQYRINNFKLSYWQAPTDEKNRLRDYWEEHMGEFPINE